MKYTYIVSLAIVFLLFNIKLSAQEVIAVPTNYYQEELFVNPAYAGVTDFLSANVALGRQWVNIDGAPSVQRLQVHSPFFKRDSTSSGLGLALENQNYGIRNQIKLNGVYAYHIALKKGTISFGLQMGFTTLNDDYGDLDVPNPNDPLLSANHGQLWGFNAGAGAYYSTNNFYVGFSIPALFDNTPKEGAGNELNNNMYGRRTPFYLTSGCVFTLSQSLKLKPAVLLNYSTKTQFRYNLNLTMFLLDSYWLGGFVRSDHEAGATLGLHVLDYFNVAYAASFTYGKPYSYQGWSHNLVVGFMWNKDKAKLRLNLI